MFCSQCGKEFKEGDKFCSSCGKQSGINGHLDRGRPTEVSDNQKNILGSEWTRKHKTACDSLHSLGWGLIISLLFEIIIIVVFGTNMLIAVDTIFALILIGAIQIFIARYLILSSRRMKSDPGFIFGQRDRYRNLLLVVWAEIILLFIPALNGGAMGVMGLAIFIFSILVLVYLRSARLLFEKNIGAGIVISK